MSIQFHILNDCAVTVVKAQGVVGAHDVIATLQDLYLSKDYTPPMQSLWDLRRANIEGGTDEVQRLAEFVTDTRGNAGATRTAVLVSRTAHFGLVRMYQVYTENLPFETSIFYELAEATTWLGVPLDEVAAVCED